ncbi:MAG: EAL domain-containing protein [Gammaproteobacteria bacterium]
MYRVIEPHLLFPLLAIVITAIIWITTIKLIKIEYQSVEKSTITTVKELTETYEAQVLRVLREIDQNLKLVRFAYENLGTTNILLTLDQQELLPLPYVFTVIILNPQGVIMASTGPLISDIDPKELAEKHRYNKDLMVSPPLRSSESSEWKLIFSYPLRDAQGAFDGVVAIEVTAALFVSGYESSKLGNTGTIGLVGSDNIVRARRTGEYFSAGDSVEYLPLITNTLDAAITLSTLPFDDINRYISARELYGFSMAAVVGLSKDEQFAITTHHIDVYILKAIFGNSTLILILALLWRMSHKLAQSHRRESDARITHAKQLEYIAFHDSLTGLPNRSLFTQLLQQSINLAQRHHRHLAVLFLDLDRFKAVNDTLGHEAGDQLLKEVASRLNSCTRQSDTVARLGGDEFVVLLPELPDQTHCTKVAQNMIDSVSLPFYLSNQNFRVTVSIGISIYPHDGQDQETLTKHADIAMYHAKEKGKNNYQVYTEKLHVESLQRFTLESSLEHALERGEFQLHYQAKRDVRTNQIAGMEALLRWRHPELGVVAPMQFIPLAEETGFIIPIGQWIIQTACSQNVAWQKLGFPSLNIAINLTERQFLDPTLPAVIQVVLNDTGMAPHLLELEINESLLMRDVPKALEIMNNLKKIGIRIAIDDFGVGYSSLFMLQQFPLDTIKIDRTFVRDLSNAQANQSLAEAIVTVGKNLSLTVVAQGVETKEQADFLRERAYDKFQGFYFHKPVSAEEITHLLTELMPPAHQAPNVSFK